MTRSPLPLAASLDGLRERDLSVILDWANDANEAPLWGVRRLMWLGEDHAVHLKTLARSMHLMVVRRVGKDAPIGLVQCMTDDRHGSGEMVYITGSGERNGRAWLQGILLAIGHLFETMPLRKIFFRTFAHNRRVIHLAESGGANYEGRFQQLVWHGDQYWDVLVWSIDRATWAEGARGAGALGRLMRIARFPQRR